MHSKRTFATGERGFKYSLKLQPGGRFPGRRADAGPVPRQPAPPAISALPQLLRSAVRPSNLQALTGRGDGRQRQTRGWRRNLYPTSSRPRLYPQRSCTTEPAWRSASSSDNSLNVADGILATGREAAADQFRADAVACGRCFQTCHWAPAPVAALEFRPRRMPPGSASAPGARPAYRRQYVD